MGGSRRPEGRQVSYEAVYAEFAPTLVRHKPFLKPTDTNAFGGRTILNEIARAFICSMLSCSPSSDSLTQHLGLNRQIHSLFISFTMFILYYVALGRQFNLQLNEKRLSQKVFKEFENTYRSKPEGVGGKTEMAQYDWQTSLGKVTQRTAFLLKSGWRSDVEFLVGQAPHQETLKAHKLLLGVASPVFEAMLLGGLAEQTQPIAIPDVFPDAFKCLLQYVYTDEVRLQSVDRAVEVCYAAKKYMLPQLVRECTHYIWKDLAAANVCKAYEFAKLFDVPILMEKCLQAAASGADEVLRSDSFPDVSSETLRIILGLDEMTVSSEALVFSAAVRWAERECERSELEPSPANIRKILGDSFYQIRFLSMTTTEFASGPAASGLFSDEEVLSFLMNIACPGSRAFPLTVASARLMSSARRICTKKYHCTLSYPSVMRFSHAPVLTELRLFVDKDILFHGIQFNSQVCPKSSSSSYQESVHVQVCDDGDGSVLAETHFSGQVAWDELVEVALATPFLVRQHRRLAVRTTFGTPGSYKCYTELLGPVQSEGVHFTCTYHNGILIGMHTITFSCPEQPPT